MDKHEGRMSKDTPQKTHSDACCEKCGGSKTDPPGQPLHSANVTGSIWVPQYFNGHEVKACPACHGTGKRREGR